MSHSRIIVRSEMPADTAAVREINLAAFGQPEEADLVDRLRESCEAAISLVAEKQGRIVGHILFTPATVESAGGPIMGMALAPMAVLPSHQRQGVGSLLVEEGLRILRSTQCPFVVLVGHPAYYPRFGFEPAVEHGLACQWDGVPDDAFLVALLDPRTMADVAGTVRFRDEFDVAE